VWVGRGPAERAAEDLVGDGRVDDGATEAAGLWVDAAADGDVDGDDNTDGAADEHAASAASAASASTDAPAARGRRCRRW